MRAEVEREIRDLKNALYGMRTALEDYSERLERIGRDTIAEARKE